MSWRKRIGLALGLLSVIVLAAGLTMVVGRHLTYADGVQDTEYSLALRGADRLAIEQDGHVRLH